MKQLGQKTKTRLKGLCFLTLIFCMIGGGMSTLAYYTHPNFSYTLRGVDCSDEAKIIRNTTPRGEYRTTAQSDACVITITVINRGDEAASEDWMAIGGGPAGVLSEPPIKLYASDGYCYGIPSQFSFPAKSSTDVWVECLLSSQNGDRDLTVDERPTKIAIDGRGRTILTIGNIQY